MANDYYRLILQSLLEYDYDKRYINKNISKNKYHRNWKTTVIAKYGSNNLNERIELTIKKFLERWLKEILPIFMRHLVSYTSEEQNEIRDEALKVIDIN